MWLLGVEGRCEFGKYDVKLSAPGRANYSTGMNAD